MHCRNLVSIYVDDGWNTEAVTYSTNMFTNCTSIRGDLGTTYDEDHVDKAYAHLDGGSANPGYLSMKPEFTLGDVNGDSHVTVADVTALINLVLSGNASVDDCPAGDINGDGNLNVADVTALINMVLRGTSGSTFQAAAKQQAAKSSPATFMTQPKELTLEPPLKHQP